jgi:hypothetical protein
MRSPALLAVLTAGLLAPACGGDAPPAQADAPPAEPAQAVAPAVTVTILEPAEGAEVQGPNVTVRLTASGIEIVPAGELRDGTGHHHLYLDADLTAASVPVPTIPGQIVHLGTGDSEFTFENVAPGVHRLIAVVADGLHIPIQPWVVDTVTFTVK